jgi:plasmid stabilization system protein ParE
LNAPQQVERFIDDLTTTINRARSHPHVFAPLRREARRASLKVFPYQIWYRTHDELEVLEVLAVVHDRQDPGKLQERLS